MELKFTKKPIRCLYPFYSQVHTQELTQEIRLPDVYPDIGKVLGCWGQVLIRGKEWRSASMGANGGVMAWVMYAPEDGTQPRVVDVWLPLQCRWDFPESADDGFMMLCPKLSNLDARSISARKMMVRSSVDIYGQALGRKTVELAQAPDMPEDVQMLRRSYPVELPVEAEEKQVQFEESVALPGNLPEIYKIVNYQVAPSISESKVLGNRLVFRGQADLRMMYMSEDGTLYNWETEIPFSQFTELDHDYSPSATAWTKPIMTAMELETAEDKQLQIRCGIAVQYTIFDKAMIEVVEDAYSPARDVTIKMEELQLPMLLDEETVEIVGETMVGAESIAAAWPFAEYPKLTMGGDGMQIHMDGQFQMLKHGDEDEWISDTARFEANYPFTSDMENNVFLWMGNISKPEILSGSEDWKVRAIFPVTVQVYSGQPISMVSELQMGDIREPDPDRPSIIVRRAGDKSLWNLAKDYGTTVSAIREANQLADEPVNGQMLLIPIS